MNADWPEGLSYIIGSVKFDNGLLYASAEAVQVTFKDNALDNNENFNVTTGWYFGPVLAYVGYSQTKVTHELELAAGIDAKLNSEMVPVIFPGVTKAAGVPMGGFNAQFSSRQQSSKMLGLKWDFMPNTALKAQVQYLDGFDGTGGNCVNTTDPGFEDVYIYDMASLFDAFNFCQNILSMHK